LDTIIKYVLWTYEDRATDSSWLASDEKTAVDLIKAYTGVSKKEVMKLLNSDGSGLN